MIEPRLRHVSVVTLFPEMFTALTDWGVVGRAFKQGVCELSLVNPRDYATDIHGSVDDRPYGGGPGMVMQPALLDCAVDHARQRAGADALVVAMTPQGAVFNNQMAKILVERPSLIFVAGRYEGMDERFVERSVDLELSIGDFVVSGGEMPAMLAIDAIVRWLPGVLGHADSAAQDSFSEGLLDYPHYTRPEAYCGRQVPEVLLSGDHGKIAGWRRAQALWRTIERRPDLMTAETLCEEDKALLRLWGFDKR